MPQIAITDRNPQEGPNAPDDRKRPWYLKAEVMVPLVISCLIAVAVWQVPPEKAQGLAHFLWQWIKARTVPDWILIAYFPLGVGVYFAIRRTLSLDETRDLLQKERERANWLTTERDQLQVRLTAVTAEKNKAIADTDRLNHVLTGCIPYEKQSKDRWESITEITYGHLEYAPFLKYEEGCSAPVGLGVDLLKKLLHSSASHSMKLEADDYRSNWKDILDGLVKGRYQVVATPLFATFERSKMVRFTSPLFFSNIGLYVSAELYKQTFWQQIRVERMKKDFERFKGTPGSLKFLAVDGEISQLLAQKYADPGLIETRNSTVLPSSLFASIAREENPPCALFCESYYAENQPLVRDKKVVNVLQPYHQILYPVCFAVRMGDYQLANLLNIRLMELTQKEGGPLEMLTKKVPMDKNKMNWHFIAEWPCSEDLGVTTHA